MTVTRRQRNYETSEQNQPSIGPSEKRRILETCQKFFDKELSEEEAAGWVKFLSGIPIGLVRAAFDHWTRTERYFPKPSQILGLVDVYKAQNTTKFRPCEQNGCVEGFVRVFEGMSTGSDARPGVPIDPKTGGVIRCQCWHQWRAGQ